MQESSPRLSTTGELEIEIDTSSHDCQINPRRPNPQTWPRSSDQFIQDFNSFKSSSAPSRILFFQNNSWVDFPRLVFDELTAGFVAGKAVFELSIDGNSYLFDFIRLIQIDLSTRAENSIAWIDINDRCFFPKRIIGKVVNEFSDETGPRFPGAEMLKAENKYYQIVKKLFLTGMRRVIPNVVVTSVHRCLYLGSSENLRVKVFQEIMELTKAARGDANVKFGWYGASAEVVAGLIKDGFRKSNIGVNLSPPHFPYGSSLFSEADEAGDKHIVLCRIIMGNPERVEAGAIQCHPSSDEFDSGVDDLTNPKWYIVWSTHMNTHILPEYIVSFKSSSKQHQGPCSSVKQKTFIAAGLSFQKLMTEIGKSLPSPSVQVLEINYNNYKAGKMSKDAFIKYIRSVVGDKLLTSAIKRIRGY